MVFTMRIASLLMFRLSEELHQGADIAPRGQLRRQGEGGGEEGGRHQIGHRGLQQRRHSSVLLERHEGRGLRRLTRRVPAAES